jgi:signal transduction histidine kinase
MRFFGNYLEKKNLELINRSDYVTDLTYLKDVIFIKCLVYVYSLSILVLIPGIFYGIYIHNYWVVFWDVLTYLSVLFLTYPTKIKLIVRKWIFVSVIYLLGFQLLMQLGMDGAGILFWIIGNISSSLLFNQIQLIYLVLVNAIGFSIIALVIYIGELPPTFSTSLSLDDWILISIHNIYLSIIISAIMNELLKILERVLDKEKKLQRAIINSATKTEQSIQLFISKNTKLEQIALVTAKDIKSPLKQVTKDIALLNDQLTSLIDEKADKYLYYAAEGAMKLKKLIAGMDKLTKIDKHVTTLDLVKIKPIFIQIIDNYLNENQTIVHKFDLDCEEINTDAYLIKKLFELIIDNSVQFKNTEIPLLLSVRIKRLSDDKWQLSITDNGIGIEEQHLNRIFQLYQRLNNNSSTNGSGVGLALAKRIVNKLNGEIWVESHLNVGTTVNISLPINTPYELV